MLPPKNVWIRYQEVGDCLCVCPGKGGGVYCFEFWVGWNDISMVWKPFCVGLNSLKFLFFFHNILRKYITLINFQTFMILSLLSNRLKHLLFIKDNY